MNDDYAEIPDHPNERPTPPLRELPGQISMDWLKSIEGRRVRAKCDQSASYYDVSGEVFKGDLGTARFEEEDHPPEGKGWLVIEWDRLGEREELTRDHQWKKIPAPLSSFLAASEWEPLIEFLPPGYDERQQDLFITTPKY